MGVRVLWIGAFLAFCWGVSAQPGGGTVAHVTDGDTFALETGEVVRLLDINTPERGRDGMPAEGLAGEATAALRKLVEGKQVRLVYGRRAVDVYNRYLAQVYLADGTWVNGEMVKAGMAHVYTFADNGMKGVELLGLENVARKKGLGIWALPRWAVKDAQTCCADEEVGLFQLVRGKPLKTTHVGDRTYMNFGRDYRTDFTVYVDDRDMKYFKRAGIKNLGETYAGRTLLVHGFTQPVNGVMVRVTHPEQIEVLE